MSRVHSVEEYIEVLKSKLGEANGNYRKALRLKDCGAIVSYFQARFRTLEEVINDLEKLQSKDKSN